MTISAASVCTRSAIPYGARTVSGDTVFEDDMEDFIGDWEDEA